MAVTCTPAQERLNIRSVSCSRLYLKMFFSSKAFLHFMSRLCAPQFCADIAILVSVLKLARVHAESIAFMCETTVVCARSHAYAGVGVGGGDAYAGVGWGGLFYFVHGAQFVNESNGKAVTVALVDIN